MNGLGWWNECGELDSGVERKFKIIFIDFKVYLPTKLLFLAAARKYWCRIAFNMGLGI